MLEILQPIESVEVKTIYKQQFVRLSDALEVLFGGHTDFLLGIEVPSTVMIGNELYLRLEDYPSFIEKYRIVFRVLNRELVIQPEDMVFDHIDNIYVLDENENLWFNTESIIEGGGTEWLFDRMYEYLNKHSIEL